MIILIIVKDKSKIEFSNLVITNNFCLKKFENSVSNVNEFSVRIVGLFPFLGLFVNMKLKKMKKENILIFYAELERL